MARAIQQEKVQGSYSITYPDPDDSEWLFSMDYKWHSGAKERGTLWRCSESSKDPLHWAVLRRIPEHGLCQMLDHFGLTKEDFGDLFFCIFDMGPSELVKMRRTKEVREGLAHKEMRNMRIGCNPNELLPENFEVAI